MDTLPILAGLLLILAGYAWLLTLAFARSLYWGLACLLPPLALLYLARHWRQARKTLLPGLLGGVSLLLGLALLASDPARRQVLLGWQGLHGDAPRPELAIALRGELGGLPFAPDYAELVDGVLSLREGEGFYARRELRIRLAQPLATPLRLDVLPEDATAVPQVEISWLAPGSDLPEARRLSRGYSLHLELQAEPPNRLRGNLHLLLPAQYRTVLDGPIELYSDRLRYRDGKPDTRIDSIDTLAYVVRDYLQRRFPDNQVVVAPLPHPDFSRRAFELPVAFSLDGRAERLDLPLARSDTQGWAVRDDHFPARAERPLPSPATPAVAVPTPAPHPVIGELALERLLAEPQRFVNRGMRVSTQSGRSAQGIFTGLDEDGRVVIRQQRSGPGEASYSLRADDILRLELLPASGR